MLDERGSHLSADATEVIDNDVRALIERGTIEEIKNGMNRKIQTSNCKTKIWSLSKSFKLNHKIISIMINNSDKNQIVAKIWFLS